MIFYSNVNEDSSAELALLKKGEFSRCLCIAGSGERLISLLGVETCTEFTCIDLHGPALYLTRLKLQYLQHYSVSDYLEITGYWLCAPEKRIRAFEEVSRFLDEETRLYWQARQKWLKKGILHCGHFERFLSRTRIFVKPFLGRSFIAQAIGKNHKSPASVRWILIKAFFKHKWIYRLFGNKDTAFVGPGARLGYIPEVLDRQLKNRTAFRSFVAHLIFYGHFRFMDNAHKPLSLKIENLEKIKKRLEDQSVNISFVQADLLQYLATESIKDPVFISGSDLLSFNPPEYISELLKHLNGKEFLFVVRAFLRNRITGEKLKERFTSNFSVKDLSFQEKSDLYQVYAISGHEDL